MHSLEDISSKQIGKGKKFAKSYSVTKNVFHTLRKGQ